MAGWGEENPHWGGDMVAANAGRGRARRRFPIAEGTLCELCPAPAYDRHHIDDNTRNNAPANIQLLCRACHMRVDGRAAALVKARPQPVVKARPVAPIKKAQVKGAHVPKGWKGVRNCDNCKQPTYPHLTKGLCKACSVYKRRTGTDRPLRLVRDKTLPRPCGDCGIVAKRFLKGMCGACYQYRRNHGVARPKQLYKKEETNE